MKTWAIGRPAWLDALDFMISSRINEGRHQQDVVTSVGCASRRQNRKVQYDSWHVGQYELPRPDA